MLFFSNSYNPALYNRIPYIDRAVEIVKSLNLEEALESLGLIFRDHAMADKFGVTLIHRHFKLGNREILIESSQTERRVSVPWTFHGNEIIGPANPDFLSSFEFPTKKSVRPQAWIFGDNLELHPFEFENIDDDGTEQEELPKEFLAKMYAELKKYDLHEILGIRVKSSDPRKGIELTDMKNRANIVTFGPPPDIPGFYLITVDWSFDADGKVIEHGRCGAGHGKHVRKPD